MEKRRGPANCRNEYDYERYWIMGNAWMYLDGLRREVRDPPGAEVQNFDGERQKLGFGEFAGSTYAEALGKKPKYAEFFMGEGKKSHLDMEKFTDRPAQRERSRDNRGYRPKSCGSKEGCEENANRRSRIWILDDFRVESRRKHAWGRFPMCNLRVKGFWGGPPSERFP